MPRYDTIAIAQRLHSVGYIYAADLAWLEKRSSSLLNVDTRLADPLDAVRAEQDLLTEIFKLVFQECTGEAHGNPHIDHCMVCMPRWGKVVVSDKVRKAKK